MVNKMKKIWNQFSLIFNGMKKFWNHFFIIVSSLIFVAIIYCFNDLYKSLIVNHLGIDNADSLRWEAIKGLGYMYGLILLIQQISISNKRADAAEKTAEATLKANTEQRYHNAVSHLQNDKPFIRIGAIYSLYHISQSTDTYDKTIFDMFCEYLSGTVNKVNNKEKQIIVDKLFRVVEDDRVFKPQYEFDLTGIDFTNIDLSNANLGHANLSMTDLSEINLTGVNLANANLTAIKILSTRNQWDNIKSLKGATLDKINPSSANMSGLNLQYVSLKNVIMIHADLSETNLANVNLTNANLTDANLTNADLTDANLTNANLINAIGLNFEQLSKVKCLYNVEGLDKEIETELRTRKPELFEPQST